jgi:hypothetical protein
VVRVRWHEAASWLKRIAGISAPAVITAAGILYAYSTLELSWPATTARAAHNYLGDVQRFWPMLPKGAVLYFEPTGMPDWPFLTGGGDLFRVFYKDETLITRFGDYGDALQESDHLNVRVFRFREMQGTLLPLKMP